MFARELNSSNNVEIVRFTEITGRRSGIDPAPPSSRRFSAAPRVHARERPASGQCSPRAGIERCASRSFPIGAQRESRPLFHGPLLLLLIILSHSGAFSSPRSRTGVFLTWIGLCSTRPPRPPPRSGRERNEPHGVKRPPRPPASVVRRACTVRIDA